MRIIYTDAHMNGANGVYGQFSNSGYSLIKIGKTIRRLDYEKKKLTNNEGELLALFHAAFLAKAGDIIMSDSQTALGQVAKGYAFDEKFTLLACAIKTMGMIMNLRFEWCRREDNPVT